jgi:hypothetical protein
MKKDINTLFMLAGKRKICNFLLVKMATNNSVKYAFYARQKGRFQTNNNVVFVNRPLIPVKGVSNNLYLQRKMI